MDRPLAGTAAGRPGSASDSTLRNCVRPASQCVDRSSRHAGNARARWARRQVAWRAYILYFELLVHTLRPGRFLAMAGGPMLHFSRDERRVCVLPALRGKVETGLWRGLNGSETAAELTLVSRRSNNPLSLAGRFLVPGSLAVFGLANSLAFAFNGAWLLVPFARLYLVVGVFRSMEHHAGYDRCVTVRGDRVVIAHWNTETSGDSIQPLLGAAIFGEPRGVESGRL